MNSENLEKIKKFIQIVEKVKLSNFIQQTKTISFELNFKAGEHLTQKVDGFSEDDFRSMLLDLRKLTLKKDGVRIMEICDLIIDNTDDLKIKDNINKCKEIYENMMENTAIKMIINGQDEKTSDLIDNWLYGYYFHEQKENEDKLRSLGVGQPLHKYNFVLAITNLVKLVILVSNNANLLAALSVK